EQPASGEGGAYGASRPCRSRRRHAGFVPGSISGPPGRLTNALRKLIRSVFALTLLAKPRTTASVGCCEGTRAARLGTNSPAAPHPSPISTAPLVSLRHAHCTTAVCHLVCVHRCWSAAAASHRPVPWR